MELVDFVVSGLPRLDEEAAPQAEVLTEVLVAVAEVLLGLLAGSQTAAGVSVVQLQAGEAVQEQAPSLVLGSTGPGC